MGDADMFIRSERLFLRPAWPEEAEELAALLADSVVDTQRTAPGVQADGDRAGEWLAPNREPLLPRFCITLPSFRGTTLIGWIGLGRDRGEVSLACWIGRAFRGQGYAAEAVRSVLSLARALGHHRIVAKHVADDRASARILGTLGFKLENGQRGAGGEAPAMPQAPMLEPWLRWAFNCSRSCNDSDTNALRPAKLMAM